MISTLKNIKMSNSLQYIEVAVEFNSRNLYTYCISADAAGKIKKGSRILVPFGRRELTGYVDKITVLKKPAEYKIREISYIINEKPLISESIIRLCLWASNHYLSPPGYLYRCAYPPGTNITSKLMVSVNEERPRDESAPPLSEKEKDILRLVEEKKNMSVKALKKISSSKSIYSLILKLKEKGFIKTFQKIEKPQTSGKFKRIIHRVNSFDFLREDVGKKLGKNQSALLELLEAKGKVSLEFAVKKTSIGSSSLKKLESSGFIKITKEREYRTPEYIIDKDASHPHTLNHHQAVATEKILDAVKEKRSEKFYLHGITGSGKTEIYMHIIRYLLSINRQALLLVPEISITPQTMARFKSRFPGKTAVLHSSLSAGERYDEWFRIYEGKAQIVIGTRSAVFAPLKDTGVIIMDEEHDDSYKQNEIPSYDARDIAAKRGELESVPVVFASASPSVDSFYKAKTGEYTYLHLPERATGIPLPSVNIIDMKKEKNKNISAELIKEVQGACDKKEQTILFLNRRGFHRTIHCTGCGTTLTCKDCSVSLVLHRSDNLMHCHYCDSVTKMPPLCPSCGQKKLKGAGRGTESLEEEIQGFFPERIIQRFDKDSLKGNKTLPEILDEFKKGNIDILVGTQMLSLGHDYPNVSVVGIIAADQELNFPDFRAAERAFQILLQVSGRCGRKNIKGKSLVQTYQPNHYILDSLKNHDYESFYENELLFRKKFNYPPFSRLINITFSGKKQIDVKKCAFSFLPLLKKNISSQSVKILGPAEPLHWKIRGKYRRQIIIKYNSGHREIISAIEKSLNSASHFRRSVLVNIDVNPSNLL